MSIDLGLVPVLLPVFEEITEGQTTFDVNAAQSIKSCCFNPSENPVGNISVPQFLACDITANTISFLLPFVNLDYLHKKALCILNCLNECLLTQNEIWALSHPHSKAKECAQGHRTNYAPISDFFSRKLRFLCFCLCWQCVG